MLDHTIFLQQAVLLTNKYFGNVPATDKMDGAKLVLPALNYGLINLWFHGSIIARKSSAAA